VTPLVEASGYRLPRIQLGLYHVTIVAPTPDNPGPRKSRRRRISVMRQVAEMAARTDIVSTGHQLVAGADAGLDVDLREVVFDGLSRQG
jgi:hypothetical protein